MKTQVTVKLIEDIGQFKRLKENWNELLDDCEAKNVFITWEWLCTWWEVYGLNNSKFTLILIELRDEKERLIGICPFKIRSGVFTRRLEFIGYGGDIKSEYLGIISKKGLEDIVVESIEKFFVNFHRIDTVCLQPLHSNNIKFLYSIKYLTIKTVNKFSKCPVVELPRSWNEFLETQSRNFRKKEKEYYRICRRDLNLNFVLHDSKNDLDSWMKELERLHHLRWNGLSQSFKSEKYRLFHHDIAHKFLDNGWLRLFFLIDGKRPIAALYCFAYNGVYYYYQSGRDPAYAKYHVGFVLMNLAIQEAINEGAKVFDMLTGEEAYKYRWAKRVNSCHQFLAFKNKRDFVKYCLEGIIERVISIKSYCDYQLAKMKLNYRKLQ